MRVMRDASRSEIVGEREFVGDAVHREHDEVVAAALQGEGEHLRLADLHGLRRLDVAIDGDGDLDFLLLRVIDLNAHFDALVDDAE